MKTTVYLDAADYRRLKALAAGEGRSAADLVRTAISRYLGERSAANVPSSLGLGRSTGDATLSEDAEELLGELEENG